MFEDLEVLQASLHLRQLLTYYVQGGSADPLAWVDRLGVLEELQPRDLTRLHGDLIAFDWIEQNTGVVPGIRPGTIVGCYRATSAGRRALEEVNAGLDLADRIARAA